MNAVPQVAVCLFSRGRFAPVFQRNLLNIVNRSPFGRIEIRFGLNKAEQDFHYALGVLCPDGVTPARHDLPGGIERLHWSAEDGLQVWL